MSRVDEIMDSKIFISYAYKDAALAKEFTAALKKAGLDAWDPAIEILPGDNPGEKIGNALKESNAMVVLLTPNAVESSNVLWEISYALGEQSYARRLIPVLIGRPESIPQEKIPWTLRQLGMINLPDSEHTEDGIRQIARALKNVA
jgi:hypothetical protein